jgi:hypothetical protein
MCFFPRELIEARAILRRERFGGVENMQHQFGAGETLVAPTDSFGFDLIGCFSKSGGIDENHWNTANVRGLFDGVACGPRDWGDDRAFVAE